MDDMSVTLLRPSYGLAPHCLIWNVRTYREWCVRVIQDMLAKGEKAWMHEEIQGEVAYCCVQGEKAWQMK